MDPRYPPPADLAELERLLESPSSDARLRAAMGSFRMEDPGVRPLLAQRLLREGNNLVKATLVKAVGRFGELGDLDLLVGFLTDPDDRVRANTVEALGLLRSPAVIPHVNRMVADPAGRVRGNAILVLATFDKKKTLTALSRMAGSPERWKRDTAAYVLGKVGGKVGVQGLASMFRREADPDLRRNLFQHLNRLAKKGDPLAAEALASLAAEQAGAADRPSSSPGELPLRSHELEDDGATWVAPEAEPPPPPVRYPEDLESEETRRRLEAVQLAPEGEPGVFERLEALLAEEEDDFVLATLVKKLPRLDGPRAYPVIRPFLEHRDGRVRANTIEGLEVTGVPEALVDVRRHLDDPHPRVRAQAARVLAAGSRDEGRPLDVLKAMLLEGDEAGALAAVHALESIDGAVILEILELALVNPRPKVRERVLFALRVMGERNALAARLAEKYSRGERIAARDQEARLLGRMNSKDPGVRYQALRRLRLVQSERARARIELAANDVSEEVRNLARATVEDFGLAYKRQGILHSLGLRALEALRAGRLEVPEAAADLERLDALTAELDASSADPDADLDPEAMAELLARRREALVGLGETVFRCAPGADAVGVRELLAQLRDMTPAPPPAPAPEGGGGDDAAGTEEALAKTMRDLRSAPLDPGEPAAPARERPRPTGPASSVPAWRAWLQDGETPKRVLSILLVMAAAAAGLFFTGRSLQGSLKAVSHAWAIPAETPCHVRVAGDFAYGVAASGEVFCVAVPTGAVKWRKGFGALHPGATRAEGFRLLLARADDHLLMLQGPKGKELWTVPAGGEVLDAGALTSAALLVTVRTGGDAWSLRSLDPEDGGERWRRDFATGAPVALSLRGASLHLVSGATLFHLDASTGKERWSFDHEEDFVGAGAVLVRPSGAVLAATTGRVVSLTPTGTLDTESPPLDPGPLRQPLDAGDGSVAVLTEAGVLVLSDVLEETSRLPLAGVPAHVARDGAAVYWADAAGRVGRFRLAEGAVLPAGSAAVSGQTRALVTAGPNPVLGTTAGVELIPPRDFR